MIKTFKTISIVCAAAFLLPAIVSAEEEKQTGTPSWYDKITVRETSDGNGNASINFTSPGDGKDSYAVNLGVAYSLKETERWYIAPVMEYHRNTALKNEQDVRSGGIRGSYRFGDVAKQVGDGFEASFSVSTDGELKYKWDDVKDDESWMPTVTFTPLYSPWGLGSSIGNDLLRVQFNLLGGVEYEEVAKGRDGDTLRATVITEAVLYPQGVMKDIIVFKMSNKYWNELSASGKFDDNDDNFNLLKIDATYYLFRNKKNDSFGVQLAYQNGADPSQGLDDQSLVTFGFVFTL
jgi:hypothetical protein